MKARYDVALTSDQLRVLAAALQELPYRLARPVLEDIQAQVSAQDATDEKAAAAAAAAAAAMTKVAETAEKPPPNPTSRAR